MHFGFSYVGIVYLLMLFIPNIKWAKNKPKDYDIYVGNENRILLGFERVGEVLTSIIVLIFSDFNLRRWTLWCLWLIVSFSLMILYELYWHRYFKSKRTMRDQYSPFCGFPVAGATLPVLAFLSLGIYGVNVYLRRIKVWRSSTEVDMRLKRMHRKNLQKLSEAFFLNKLILLRQ